MGVSMPGMFIGMAASGLSSVPAKIAELHQAEDKAKQLCRHTRWNLHRAEQLGVLTKDLNKDYNCCFGPALKFAQTADANWKLSITKLKIDKAITDINGGVLIILMIVYVLLAWFCLLRKRQTLQEAFYAVHNVQFT